jgi:hypothetical protein
VTSVIARQKKDPVYAMCTSCPEVCTVSGDGLPLQCGRAVGMRTQYFLSLLVGGAAWCVVQVVTGGCEGA